jgi:elongation factor P--beta-lysine ligase
MHIIDVEEKMSRSPGFMEEKRRKMLEEFRKLTPMERMMKMNAIFDDMIAFKAKNEGVSEYEIYRRIVKADREIKRRRNLKLLLENAKAARKEADDEDQLII